REQLPEDISPTLGPISTGLGEIYLWTVEAEEGATKEDGSAYTPTDLRTIQDWIIRPQLRNVKGVAEINTIGGYAKQFLIAPDPKKLAAYKLTLGDLQNAVLR
ncbi:efflux RND transporter permease subunit, partial [Pseudomonas aeruginosa]